MLKASQTQLTEHTRTPQALDRQRQRLEKSAKETLTTRRLTTITKPPASNLLPRSKENA